MLEAILKFFRTQPKSTAALFLVVFLFCFGIEGAMYAFWTELFIIIYLWIITSGDDDDFFPPIEGPWRLA